MLDVPNETLAVRALVCAPLIDLAFRIVAAGCEAVDLRGRLSELSAGFPSADDRAAVSAVITTGTLGLEARHMDLLPNLRVISCFGAGYELVDLEAATARGIAVTNAPATNGDTVADHAILLMLAAARGLLDVAAAAREGRWMEARALYRPTLSGATVGILGLGTIGQAIASRAAAFDTTIHYTTRTVRADLPYDYVPDVVTLARKSDFLVIALPGGSATRHLVGADVLTALGPDGILVNVGRGSVVDSEALADALTSGRIHAAGIDVFEEEPDVPAALLDAPNLVITPHLAGRSPRGLRRQCDLVLDNLGRLLRDEPLACRVA